MVFLNKIVSEGQSLRKTIMDEDFNNDVPSAVLLNKFSKKEDPIASRPPVSNVTSLQNKSLWSLDNSFEAMRVSRDERYDGVDEWTGQTIQSYVADPPEADSNGKLNIRRYQNAERTPKAQGEQMARLPRPDRTINGRNFDKLRNNSLSTTRLSNSHPLLGDDRTASKALNPTTLHADDITPSMMIGEEGPHGAFGDRTHRAEFFKGGLHPSTRHKQNVNGVNNLKSNAADYGHVNQTEHNARMLPDQNRTPQLRENEQNIDQANNILNSTNHVPGEVVGKIKVGRVPVRFDNNPIRKEGTAVQAAPAHLKVQNSPYAAVPTATQSHYKPMERSEASHFHKERNAPEISVVALRQDFSSKHVFKIDGALPTTKERMLYPSKLTSDNLTYNNRAFESEIQAARRTDMQNQNPKSHPEQETSNYASRNKIGDRDRTQFNSRFEETEQHIARPLPVDIHTIKNSLAPTKEIINDAPVNRYQTQVDVMEDKNKNIPDVRLDSGRRQVEKNVANPDRLHADFTASGWKMDSSQRIHDPVQLKTNPGVGKSTPLDQNSSSFGFNIGSSLHGSGVDYVNSRYSTVPGGTLTNGFAQIHSSSIPISRGNNQKNEITNSFSSAISSERSGKTWHPTYASGKY